MDFLWTSIHVNDIEASAKFYKEIVELEESRKMEYPDGTTILFLGSGPTKVELIYRPGIKINKYSKDLSIGFKVDSVDDMMEKVKAAGYDIALGPIEPNPKIKFFFVFDPMGVNVQFVEMK